MYTDNILSKVTNEKHHKVIRRIAPAAAIFLVAAALCAAGSADAAPERRQSLSGNVTGYTTRTPTQPSASEVQLLTGFDFMYRNSDHHLTSIAALPSTDGSFLIEFHDRNFDDPITYRIDLSKISLPGTITPPTLTETCGGGRCTYDLRPPPNDRYVFVLRGFHFGFREDGLNPFFPLWDNCNVFDGCDHHLREVGILYQGDNKVTVAFADQNGDDDYVISLSYTWVPRSLVSGFVGSANITISDTGVYQRTNRVQPGSKAISGFWFRYADTQQGGGFIPSPLPRTNDEHALRLGYRLADTSITAYFQDKDPTNSPPWVLKYNYVMFR